MAHVAAFTFNKGLKNIKDAFVCLIGKINALLRSSFEAEMSQLNQNTERKHKLGRPPMLGSEASVHASLSPMPTAILDL